MSITSTRQQNMSIICHFIDTSRRCIDENRENLPARLVGNGVLEEEEDDLLMPEIEELIERSGDDALAEEFLRYE